VHWLLAFALLGGCDLVFSLDRPAPGQFCLQPANVEATLCADFDDEDGTDPLARFDTPDDPSRYAIDEEAAHSAPFGARLTLAGMTSVDARMMRLFTNTSRFEASTWIRITRINTPPVDSVKVMALHFGAITNSTYERVVHLTSEGNVIQRVGTTYPRVAQLDAMPIDRWVHLTVGLDIESSTGSVDIDGEVAQFEITPIAAPATSDRVLMTIGPHDPEPFDMGVDLEILYDDIVITTTPR
jgi:hypothetical protein